VIIPTSLQLSLTKWFKMLFTWEPIAQSILMYPYSSVVGKFRCLWLGIHILPEYSPKGTNKSSISKWDDATCNPKVHLDLFKEHHCCILSLMFSLECTRMHILLNPSTTTSRYSYPHLVLGKPPMKSMDMLSHGLVGICKEWYIPCFLLLGLLV